MKRKLKSDVIREVHALIHKRLFGRGPWLRGNAAMVRKFEELGLHERFQKSDGFHYRTTALGCELNSELMSVFSGVWFDDEVPMILGENGLIWEDEQAELYERFCGPESSEFLLPVVRRAFFDYFRANVIAS